MSKRVVLRSKNVEKIKAFIIYADDAEGMRYSIGGDTQAGWHAYTTQDYDAQVERALLRNFRDEWEAVS